MLKGKLTIIILWMTFLTVFAWIGFSIYHIWVTSTISDIDATAIIPIDPAFDTATINKLKGRESVEPLYRFNNSILLTSPTPIQTEQTPDSITSSALGPTITAPTVSPIPTESIP